MPKLFTIGILAALLCACTGILKNQSQKAQSQGEVQSGYTYVPIDPFPVAPVYDRLSCLDPSSHSDFLDLLPDNAVRTLVEEIDLSGTVKFGPSKIAAKDNTYRVTVDYINADTVNVQFWINKVMRILGDPNNGSEYTDLYAPPPSNVVPGTESYTIYTEKPDEQVISDKNLQPINIPIYVGIGLRVTANVQAIGGNANISGIGVIGAEADANLVRGTLVVQTLGVNGKSIAAALPIQSELNTTTAQNAVVAVGSIKALLYSSETITAPRIVGLYLPFPGGQTLVNALVSAISKNETQWHPECVAKASGASNPQAAGNPSNASAGSPPKAATPAGAANTKSGSTSSNPVGASSTGSSSGKAPQGAKRPPASKVAEPKEEENSAPPNK
jgi:hypothetical protein